MADIVAFPGTQPVQFKSGQPRPDIAEMLRGLAERAERGEIDALVVGASIADGGMITGLSTVENCFYSMLGVCEELKQMVYAHRDQAAPTKVDQEWE